ncbi:MAG: Lar family restriction alleviation protein [Synergistaceae bacterium]|nr:Lar family restriction alleviation protein [Synergistaceae bacterium]
MKIDNLKPCPYCGGKAEYKHKQKRGHITLGASFHATRESRYIRCSRCHARTQDFGKLINIINAWNLGIVYKNGSARD